MTLKKPGNSRSICWNPIKLIEDIDPRMIKNEINCTHWCTIFNITLSLSLIENKNSKHGKASGNYQTAQAMHYLIKEHSEASDIVATATTSKVKVEVKKEGIKRNLINSYESE